MKTLSERIKRNMTEPRTMTAISLRLPERMIEDLKEVAPQVGLNGYQSLIRAYLSQGLRTDLVRIERKRVANGIREAFEAEGLGEAAIVRATEAALRAQGFEDVEMPTHLPTTSTATKLESPIRKREHVAEVQLGSSTGKAAVERRSASTAKQGM